MSEDDTTFPPMGHPQGPEGIKDTVRLIIDTEAGCVLDTTLIMAAVVARYGTGEITPFIYRDPFDPEEPNAPRPLRRAVLRITDDEIVTEEMVQAYYAATTKGAEGANR